jgi:hypothetical protein
MLSPVLNFAGLIAAIAAAAAALFTFMQARSARAALQTQLFLSFSSRYSDPEMGKALMLLINWYKANPETFADIWFEGFLRQEEGALRLEQARRMVSIFFVDVARLYESKQINRQIAYHLLAYSGLDVYYNVCHPMWKKLHAERYGDYAEVLKQLRPGFTISGSFDPV